MLRQLFTATAVRSRLLPAAGAGAALALAASTVSAEGDGKWTWSYGEGTAAAPAAAPRGLPNQPTLKLVYFDGPGKAEGTRLAAAHCGLALEDYRFKDRAEFMAMKESGELTYGQVPALFVDGKQVTQSSCILRTVGRLGGLYPEDVVQAALVDSIMDQEIDMTMGISCSNYQVNPESCRSRRCALTPRSHNARGVRVSSRVGYHHTRAYRVITCENLPSLCQPD